jgi:RNA polymerase sigma-70 factor (ECF subfamily)
VIRSDNLERVYQAESRHVLATLIRLLGDFELAEDALHEAFLAAAQRWPHEGEPRNPRAWLISAGRFQAIDVIRRRARHDASVRRLAAESTWAEELNLDFNYIPDDDLRLIFLCCHPALPMDAQIALTLREACGLTTEEIAQAYLAKASAIAQRIVRAKSKIRDAAIAYDLPPQSELPERLRGVLHVIYLLFNEGYESSYGSSLMRVDLCGEAIRLARLVVEILPEPEVYGMLAMMMFHHARVNGRAGPSGELILLEHQDRSKWDRAEIAHARGFLNRALLSGRMGRYTCQAAIAALHAEARSAQETNWTGIVEVYDALLEIDPSPVVALNRAVAIAMRDGPAAGLAIVEAILARGDLSEYRFAHAARADMYRRLGRASEAQSSYDHALALTQQGAERRFLAARIADLELQGSAKRARHG